MAPPHTDGWQNSVTVWLCGQVMVHIAKKCRLSSGVQCARAAVAVGVGAMLLNPILEAEDVHSGQRAGGWGTTFGGYPGGAR